MGVASCAVAPCCTWPCPFGRHNLHPRGKTFGTGERPCQDYVPTLSGTPKNATAALKLGFAPPTKWPYSLSVRAGITSPHFPAPQKTLTREQAVCLLRSSRGGHYCALLDDHDPYDATCMVRHLARERAHKLCGASCLGFAPPTKWPYSLIPVPKVFSS